MESTIKLLEIKGVKVPNFNEPKGMAFEKAMKELDVKVHKQTVKRNDSVNQINRIQTELNKVKAGILMAEDEFEEMELKKRKKDLQEELGNVDDYSSLNVGDYAKKLINNPAIQKLEAEAREEYLKIKQVASEYVKELDKQYAQTKKEIERFVAGGASESNYRTGAVSFNRHNNA